MTLKLPPGGEGERKCKCQFLEVVLIISKGVNEGDFTSIETFCGHLKTIKVYALVVPEKRW